MTRVAAVDLGTNTTRLLVADVENAPCRRVVRRGVVTRARRGRRRGQTLGAAAIDRVFAVLAGFRVEAETLGAERTLAVGTSAVATPATAPGSSQRSSAGSGLRRASSAGTRRRRCTRRGIGQFHPTTLVLDVGGGSTELVLGNMRTSVDVGSVRLTERHLRSDPPARAELAAADAHVRSLLPDLEPRAAIGVRRAPSGNSTHFSVESRRRPSRPSSHSSPPPAGRAPPPSAARPRSCTHDRRRRADRRRGASPLRVGGDRLQRARSARRNRSGGCGSGITCGLKRLCVQSLA